ncbi:NAD(P)-dependent dehydrogenase, short-chain alcohol dehydrogenase family [Saccharopolyspora antimicrobica]|uniref:NAD(P)-dependent dehydrogenase (Short-subunit alcohol dehydrogenase family) n=1 Tax=Saccharopolyspora antimicrobica TaxID=455193 RepID=A0A1I5CLQ7_9PSEU|nr:SDR family oxidoreductase [Saccharopolyspora antimicrobica]RKT88817.1 NAD(P)-dependent dehydrogenase (short-subunit alcohol dehydrogenase family) [Saccharopolyspora antimicrobica]SFN87822.1 NAD(P)-dependent dehydrogenase, short-chain alcohol dehydrogenase family [Saccharopolyspora antimicrobica]
MMLDGEVVVISGVGPGLGARLAAGAAAQGAKVVLAARSTEVVDQEVRRITDLGGEALGVSCDVRKPDEADALVAAAVERFGAITGLVNSAYGHPGFGDLLDAPEKALRRSMDIILFGALNMTRAVVPQMRAAGRGSVVNIGTMTTRKPMRGDGGYAVAKAAMTAATRSLALELGEHGIRVNQAAMGWLDGPGVRFHLKMTAEQRGISEQEVYDEIAARNPLGRIPTDEDCTGPVLFLLSRHASEVTGATLDVNGGEYMPA